MNLIIVFCGYCSWGLYVVYLMGFIFLIGYCMMDVYIVGCIFIVGYYRWVIYWYWIDCIQFII